jgi:hypothetical protein
MIFPSPSTFCISFIATPLPLYFPEYTVDVAPILLILISFYLFQVLLVVYFFYQILKI